MDFTQSLLNEIGRQALHLVRRGTPNARIEADSLVQEACIRILRHQEMVGADDWGAVPRGNDRFQFLAYSARVLRSTLVDIGERRRALKRRGDTFHLSLEDTAEPAMPESGLGFSVLDVHEKLAKLARLSPDAAQLVELRYFGGYTCREIAEAKGVEQQRIEDQWRSAKRWLRAELADHARPA